jgi:hypothetical protein
LSLIYISTSVGWQRRALHVVPAYDLTASSVCALRFLRLPIERAALRTLLLYKPSL